MWIKGDKMIESRMEHSCFYDNHSNSIFVIGGWHLEPGNAYEMFTTHQLNLDTEQWEFAPYLPKPLGQSAAVASNSIDYIGFIAGGGKIYPKYKVFGLRRRDLTWELMPQRLQTARSLHSMVNVANHEVPGC